MLVMGYDLGMNTPGGYGQHIRVPGDWIVPMPAGLDAQSAMLWGTAGFTAALCVEKLQQTGMVAGGGPVLVTGASGGVGSVAVALLSKLGFEVAAVTGKAESRALLESLGASHFLTREEAADGAAKPLLGEQWGGVVDTVGGPILFNAIKGLRYGASAAACGLAASPELSGTVLPFILRHVNLLGIDSVELPIAHKRTLWNRMGGEWSLDLSSLEERLTLDQLEGAIARILAGNMVGRGLVDLGA